MNFSKRAHHACMQVFRTPIVHKSVNPVWNWQFEARLPADIGIGGCVLFRVGSGSTV